MEASNLGEGESLTFNIVFINSVALGDFSFWLGVHESFGGGQVGVRFQGLGTREEASDSLVSNWATVGGTTVNIPEPAPLLLMGIGLLVAFLFSTKKRV